MMAFRLLASDRLAAISDPLVKYRVHGDNWSLSVEAIEGGMLGALDQVFDDPEADPRYRPLRRRASKPPSHARRVVLHKQAVAPGRAPRGVESDAASLHAPVLLEVANPPRAQPMTRRIKVLHVITDAEPNAYFGLIAAGTDRDRFDVRFASLCSRGVLQDQLHDSGLPSAALGADHRRQYPQATIKLARMIRRSKIDVVQGHLLDACFVGLLAARLANAPAPVMTAHHCHEIPLIARRALTAVDRLSAKATCRRRHRPQCPDEGHVGRLPRGEPVEGRGHPPWVQL